MESKYEEFPDEVRHVLRDLAFIKAVKPGQKIDLTTRNYIEPIAWRDLFNWIAWLQRSLNNESRTNTVQYITDILKRVAHVTRAHPQFRPLVLDYLAAARTGVESLRETYSYHPGTRAEFDVLLDELSALFTRLRGSSATGEAADSANDERTAPEARARSGSASSATDTDTAITPETSAT